MAATKSKSNPLIEFLLGSLTGAIATIGESKLEDALQDLHDKDPKGYKAVIAAGDLFVTKITPIVQKSATKIDDAVLTALGDAIKSSASKNGINL